MCNCKLYIIWPNSYITLFKILVLFLILSLTVAVIHASESKGDVNYTKALAYPIIVEEYPLEKNTQGKCILSEKKLDEKLLAKRAPWRPVFDRDTYHNQRREAFNKKLADFELKLVLTTHKGWRQHYRCDLLQFNDLILENILPRALEVNESKTDFALVADNTPNKQPLVILIQKNSIKPYSWGKTRLRDDQTKTWITLGHAVRPVFLNNKLLSVEWVDTGINNPATYEVKHENEVVFTGSAPHIAINPVRALYASKGHWILEVSHRVFIDGISLNQQMDCEKIFRYVFFKDKPLYFFEKRGKMGISYNGNTLPLNYQYVAHYPCCENPGIRVGEDMIQFFGSRNDSWHYVEMGIYEQ